MNSAADSSPGVEQMVDGRREPDPCDRCGRTGLIWRKCKLVCQACGTINKSCADL